MIPRGRSCPCFPTFPKTSRHLPQKWPRPSPELWPNMCKNTTFCPRGLFFLPPCVRKHPILPTGGGVALLRGRNYFSGRCRKNQFLRSALPSSPYALPPFLRRTSRRSRNPAATEPFPVSRFLVHGARFSFVLPLAFAVGVKIWVTPTALNLRNVLVHNMISQLPAVGTPLKMTPTALRMVKVVG